MGEVLLLNVTLIILAVGTTSLKSDLFFAVLQVTEELMV